MAPHTAARWQWFDDAPVPGIWRAHQSEAELERRAALESLDWRAEGVLLTRPGGQVRVSSASRATCAFLDACARSAPLPEALAAAADARMAGPEPFDPATLLRCLLDAGALRALDNDS
ncbi:MAG: hypothetical protein IH616_11065 [Gemmatimonadales bacterium]|nr:hypothetical protein [Gemmatimonadales bacterium]